MTELATQELARARAARIRAGIATYLHTLADVSAAYQQRDWTALGYADWQSYVDGEFSEAKLRLSPEHRAKAVAELRLAGMSQRAIGTALGVSVGTVNADLAGVQDRTPAEIQGADGKTYAATRPQTPAPSPEPGPASTSAGPGHDHPPRTGEADARLDAAVDAAASEAPTGIRPSAGAGDNFERVLDHLVPDSNPHREWQSNFLRAVGGVDRLLLFTSADVAERADQECLDELIRVADRLATWRAEVVQTRILATPDNVRPIRRIS